MDKKIRIKKEIERITGFFESMPDNKLAVITPLIENASFMRVVLEDLQESIVDQGTTDHYQNGENQHGQKISAQLQSYNSLLKNYVSVTKTLYQYMPSEVRKPVNPFTLDFSREKTPEEIEEEERKTNERLLRIRKEVLEASERQKQEREKKKMIQL